MLVVSTLVGARGAPLSRVERRRTRGGWSWQFFLLGAGFMLLETKSIIQFALLWGSTWVVASLAIASVLSMALVANCGRRAKDDPRPWLVGGVLVALLALNYLVPIGRVAFDSRAAESLFYAVAGVQPDPVRGPAVRIRDRAVDVADARLRHRTCSARWSAASASICRS